MKRRLINSHFFSRSFVLWWQVCISCIFRHSSSLTCVLSKHFMGSNPYHKPRYWDLYKHLLWLEFFCTCFYIACWLRSLKELMAWRCSQKPSLMWRNFLAVSVAQPVYVSSSGTIVGSPVEHILQSGLNKQGTFIQRPLYVLQLRVCKLGMVGMKVH